MSLRFWRRGRQEELGEEIESHLRMAARERVERGENPRHAEQSARREFGNAGVVREVTRDQWGWRWLESLFQDVRYGARTLRKSAGFTAVSVLTLALGIGANTAIFSAVNPILFEPLPYPHPNRIVVIWEVSNDGSRNGASFGMYHGLAERTRSFDALSLSATWQPTLTGTGQPERIDAQRVSWTYFRVSGVSPILGRDFQASEDLSHGPNVVILSDRLWHRRFGGDPSIVGNQITLAESGGFADTDRYTVIGVMPRSFENVQSPTAEAWAPLQIGITQGRAWGHWLRMIGRLRPGVSIAQATQELTALAHQVLQEQHPDSYGTSVKYSIASLQNDLTSGVKSALFAVLGAVMLVLLIACVNVTNLLLARGALRRGEFAMRAALGAGRARLAQQLLTESLLVALIGGALGLLVAQSGVQAIIALSPPDLPRLQAIGVDRNVFLFALCITAFIGLLVGLIPALHASRTDLNIGLREGARQSAGSHQLTQRTLVVAEVALALVLLVSAGLLLRSIERLFAVPPGFNPSHALSMQIDEVGNRYDPDGVRYQFWTETLDAVQRVPGVEAAGFTNALPLSGDGPLDRYGVGFEIDHNPGKAEDAMRYAVTPSYFQTMGISLKQGRFLEDSDRTGSPPVALISESFAKRKFGSINPIGQRLHIGPPTQWYTIVGVVGDVKQMSLALSQSDAVYTTLAQWDWVETTMSLVVRARGSAAALTSDIRNAVWSVDRDLPIDRVATMDELLATSAAERQFTLILFEAFGIVALALAAVGIYGVLSGSVTERTHEIGIRAALGASRGNILALVIRQGMTLTGLGVVIGLAAAFAASQAIATLLFGISPLDPLTYFGVIALLLAVSAIACWVPAWRAARVDPMAALRYE